MQSTVLFADLRTTVNKNMSKKIAHLLEHAAVGNIIQKNDLVAIKMHFGEKGNTAFIRPILIRYIVDKVNEKGGRPFLTDTNTLYRGERSEAVSHLRTALKHGFGLTTVDAPLIIADGLKGNDFVGVPINGTFFSQVSVAAGIKRADVLIAVAHFKGHELTGFGGALKNLGMGCASREGKLRQHCDIAPHVQKKLCRACKRCMAICPADAITLNDKKAFISAERCIGCAECISLCPFGAIKINWSDSTQIFQKKMVEYSVGVLRDKQNKSLFINFLTNISPACDCYGHADQPIVPDIGILASVDPVALDQASADLVNMSQGIAGSALKFSHDLGGDKFRDLYPMVDWTIQLDYAQSLGLGTREYNLIKYDVK